MGGQAEAQVRLWLAQGHKVSGSADSSGLLLLWKGSYLLFLCEHLLGAGSGTTDAARSWALPRAFCRTQASQAPRGQGIEMKFSWPPANGLIHSSGLCCVPGTDLDPGIMP